MTILKNRRNKMLISLALFLVLTISATLIALPVTYAHDPPWTNPTTAFIAVAPNPIGVGQNLMVAMWLSIPPPTSIDIGGDRWKGMTVTITKPDGTKETQGPFTSDPLGDQYFMYKPDIVGKYYFQMSFPGQTLAAEGSYWGLAYVGDYFEPSTSPKAELIVQQDQIPSWPAAPLPTDYWQRPINAENREWYTISGNWLATGWGTMGTFMLYNATYASTMGEVGANFVPYTTAPNSAHIIWTKPLDFGGLIGGEYGGGGTSSYYTGTGYEPKFAPPIIISGILYYNAPDPPRNGFTAVDLRTGKTLWEKNGTITCGQIYNYISPNQYGGNAYLWSIDRWDGTKPYSMYDAFTGNWILDIVNASTPSARDTTMMVSSPRGDLLMYVLDGRNSWLALWNSSKIIANLNPYDPWSWRPPAGASLSWSDGIEWNVTTPEYKVPQPQAPMEIDGDVLVAYTGDWLNPQDWQMEIGYSLIDGHVMWVQNRTTSAASLAWTLWGPIGEGVYCEFHKRRCSGMALMLYGKQDMGSN